MSLQETNPLKCKGRITKPTRKRKHQWRKAAHFISKAVEEKYLKRSYGLHQIDTKQSLPKSVIGSTTQSIYIAKLHSKIKSCERNNNSNGEA